MDQVCLLFTFICVHYSLAVINTFTQHTHTLTTGKLWCIPQVRSYCWHPVHILYQIFILCAHIPMCVLEREKHLPVHIRLLHPTCSPYNIIPFSHFLETAFYCVSQSSQWKVKGQSWGVTGHVEMDRCLQPCMYYSM